MAGIISVYIVSKAGGLIFSHDQPNPNAEVEATFSYPLGLVLEEVDRHVVVKYGERHGIQGAHTCSLQYPCTCTFSNHSELTLRERLENLALFSLGL